MVVRPIGQERPAQPGAFLDRARDVGRVVDEDLYQRVVVIALPERAEVAQRVVWRVVEAGRGSEVVRRDPGDAARDRRRAAHVVGVLEQRDLGTRVDGGECSGEPSGTGTDDDHVVLAATHLPHARTPVG